MQFGNKNSMNYIMPLKITMPADNSTANRIYEIRGTGQPFSYIFIQIEDKPYLVTSVDINGYWIISDIDFENTYALEDGEHIIKVTQNQYYQYEYDSITVNILKEPLM